MKLKTKNRLYLIACMLGIALIFAAKLFPEAYLSGARSGALIGIGAGLFGFGMAKWFTGRFWEKHPDLMKQNGIELRDERNQLIRSKAQALSGEIFHWLLMAAAWAAIFWDAPLWVTLSFVGAFLLKTALDLILCAFYRHKM